MTIWSTIAVLATAVAVFGGMGVVYALRRPDASLDEFLTARGTTGTGALGLTLFASGVGAWLLFSPAESAVWGGVPALLGYAVGSALPLLVFIPLARRMRRLLPAGHTLTEYVGLRFGRPMYAFTLVLVALYLFFALAAEVTAAALLVRLVGGVPLWVTALGVLLAPVVYTALGGLGASIFTDRIQTLVVLPLLALVGAAALVRLGDLGGLHGRLVAEQPALLGLGYGPGVESGLALVLGILAANLFDQGFWQRVYAARDDRALGRGFALASALVFVVVLAAAALGLVAVAAGLADDPSIALFAVLQAGAPGPLLGVVVVLGVALVMSSVDSLLNGLASIVAADGVGAWPTLARRPGVRRRLARWVPVAFAVPAFFLAVQGLSVLYLFLLADLACAAAFAPVFGGLYLRRLDGRGATLATLAGLVVGAAFFPDPAFTRGSLLLSFALAFAVPAAIVLLARPWARPCDLETLAARAERYED